MPLIDLVNQSGNDEAILSLWLVSVSTDDCGYTFTTKNGMVSLDYNMAGVLSGSSSHMPKYNCPFAKYCLRLLDNINHCIRNPWEPFWLEWQ